MTLPLYSQWRGGFDTSVLELCTDTITIAEPSERKQADDGGYFYQLPLSYEQLGSTSVVNPYAETPSQDPFFYQLDNDPTQPAYFRCQFVISQKETMAPEGSSLIISGRYVLPAAPWIDYKSFMNQYNWFYRRDNTDLKNPKGFEKIKVVSISPKHDLNRNISHYEIQVAR